jgi:hypothetical protein
MSYFARKEISELSKMEKGIPTGWGQGRLLAERAGICGDAGMGGGGKEEARQPASLNWEFVIENLSFVIRKDGLEGFAKNARFSGIAPRKGGG